MTMQEMAEERYGTATPARRAGARPGRGVRDAAGKRDDGSEGPGLRRTGRTGVRLTFRPGVVPRSRRGWVVAGAAVLAGLGIVAGGVYVGERFLLRDERFTIPSSASIQIEGNSHMTRAQLLSVFGEDVERNVFTVSLAERRAELEQMPWVERATVMRLLPNRLRVRITERTPVAFVRQGRHIGLVDRNGVLLDLAGEDGSGAADKAGGSYSFPVVTGISQEEPLSVRRARMAIYGQFAAELDAGHEGISGKLSEVDLSNPEDVKALIPEGGTEILVHFGDSDFLERYRKFEEQLPGWQAQYPKLASADMRYERQVVLEMQPGAAVPVEGTGAGKAGPANAAAEHAAAAHPAAKKASKGAAHAPSKAALHAMGQPHFPEH